MRNFYLPISAWITARNEAHAEQIADQLEKYLQEHIDESIYDVKLEFHSDCIEDRGEKQGKAKRRKRSG